MPALTRHYLFAVDAWNRQKLLTNQMRKPKEFGFHRNLDKVVIGTNWLKRILDGYRNFIGYWTDDLKRS